jgi:CRP-like cAMP-binding protein
MSIEDDISVLERIATFASFGFSALQIIAIGAESKQLQAGEVLFRAGEPADAGYVIMQGALKLTRKGGRIEQPEMTLGPGVLIGELALLTETSRPVDATATEPTTVMRIPRSLFRRVLEGFPEAARSMRDRLAERVNQASEEIAEVRGTLVPPRHKP